MTVTGPSAKDKFEDDLAGARIGSRSMILDGWMIDEGTSSMRSSLADREAADHELERTSAAARRRPRFEPRQSTSLSVYHDLYEGSEMSPAERSSISSSGTLSRTDSTVSLTPYALSSEPFSPVLSSALLNLLTVEEESFLTASPLPMATSTMQPIVDPVDRPCPFKDAIASAVEPDESDDVVDTMDYLDQAARMARAFVDLGRLF